MAALCGVGGGWLVGCGLEIEGGRVMAGGIGLDEVDIPNEIDNMGGTLTEPWYRQNTP